MTTVRESFRRPLSKSVRYPRTCRRRRCGLTLIEMLVAMTITLIMVLAVVQIFEVAGTTVANGRATLEMSGQLRAVEHRLRQDLAGVTVPMLPWPMPGAGQGYFEYYEGSMRDIPVPNAANTTIGDFDDVLMFTARSSNEPFVGRVQGGIVKSPTPNVFETIESRLAEVIWWCRFEDANANGSWDMGEQITLHRRVLMVRPDLNDPSTGSLPGIGGITTPAALVNFYNSNDVSVRPNGSGGVIANSLADLTKRENRIAHDTTKFPYVLSSSLLPLQTNLYLGEDVMLSNVVNFDVKAFDPIAKIRRRTDTNRAIVPSDAGYGVLGPTQEIGEGAFVDLNYVATLAAPVLGTISSTFSGPVNPKSQMSGASPAATYCTWSYHYEHDGVNQDNDTLIDEGTNGLDDDDTNGVDDVGERETSPPYPYPLRGLQVTLRIVEHNSQQVRQTSVITDFTPE